MRIFLYSRAFYPSLGGVEQSSLLLARELSRRGHRVAVATDVEADSALDASLGFEVIRAPSRSSLVRAARAADLVHANGYSAIAYGISGAARRPLVFTHHGYQASCLVGLGWHDGHRCESRLLRCAALTTRQRGASYAARQLARHFLARFAQGTASGHVAVSRFVRDVIAMPRSSVIYNCVDTSVFVKEGSPASRERFLFVGRFVAEKGVDVLLRAVALSARLGSPVLLDLVGAGPLEDGYRRLVRELEIDRFVAFRGPLRGTALATAMRESLAVVVPSTWDEAFGIVAAEAISCWPPRARVERGWPPGGRRRAGVRCASGRRGGLGPPPRARTRRRRVAERDGGAAPRPRCALHRGGLRERLRRAVREGASPLAPLGGSWPARD